MKGSDAARYVNDAITFEQSENATFKMFYRLHHSHRYLQLDAPLCIVAGFVVPGRHTDTHTDQVP